jgi:predicted Rossmann fold nucleotide-binding protein DprA/Smf involved in DNA uptake
LDKGAEILLDALGFDLVGVDELIARTGLSSQILAPTLLWLELSGVIALHSGGRYQRVR